MDRPGTLDTCLHGFANKYLPLSSMIERAPVEVSVALGYREPGSVEGCVDQLRIVLPEPEMALGLRGLVGSIGVT